MLTLEIRAAAHDTLQAVLMQLDAAGERVAAIHLSQAIAALTEGQADTANELDQLADRLWPSDAADAHCNSPVDARVCISSAA